MSGLSHHSHSGRFLPHHHTSYGALGLAMLLVGAILLTVTGAARADNGDISVSGIVKGAAPAAAPTIAVPTNGQHFTTNPITVSGTCETGLVVKVFKNLILAGATICQSGGFSLPIDLVPGKNDLLARQYDGLDQPSPDSQIVTVYLDGQTGLTSANPRPTTPGSAAGSVIAPLLIKTDTAVKGSFPERDFTWTAEIVGGVAPYAVTWDWGDGQVELISQPSSGSLTVKHHYARPGQYTVKIKAADATGQTAQLQLVGLVSGQPAVKAGSKPTLDGRLQAAWPLYAAATTMVLTFWLGELFDRRHRRRQVATA